MTWPLRWLAASAASTIDSATKMVARIEVPRVRKSAAPRALIIPAGLPPPASPPPSERCTRMKLISSSAIAACRMRRKVNRPMVSMLSGKCGGDLGDHGRVLKGCRGWADEVNSLPLILSSR